jgi:hypothetical protein
VLDDQLLMLPDLTGAQAVLDSLLRDVWAASKPSRVADTKKPRLP